METKYWKEKWEAKDTQFHKEVPNAQLVSHFSNLTPRRVAVPLCGKSLDMAWLLKQGHEVMGFELSPLACEAFFQENSISVKKEPLGEGALFLAEKIAIWCGDIFKSPPSLWKNIGSIYDRAALVALPPDMRKDYARFLTERSPKGTNYFLITYEYHSDKELGPPFSVSEKEVRELFEAHFQVKKLRSGADADLTRRPGKFSETEVTEHVFELNKIQG